MNENDRKYYEIGAEILRHFDLDNDARGLMEGEIPVYTNILLTTEICQKVNDKISDIQSSNDIKVIGVVISNEFMNFLCVTREDIESELYKSSLRNNIVFCYVENLINSDFSEYGDCVFYTQFDPIMDENRLFRRL